MSDRLTAVTVIQTCIGPAIRTSYQPGGAYDGCCCVAWSGQFKSQKTDSLQIDLYEFRSNKAPEMMQAPSLSWRRPVRPHQDEGLEPSLVRGHSS